MYTFIYSQIQMYSDTKQCLIVFSLWCKKVALAIKEKHSNKTWSGQSVRIISVPKVEAIFYW